MAALSALLPVASIEKTQQHAGKQQDSFAATKQSIESVDTRQDKASSGKEQESNSSKSDEFEKIYQADIQAYGEAERSPSQSLMPLKQVQLDLQETESAVEFTLLEGSVLPLEGESLPLDPEAMTTLEPTSEVEEGLLAPGASAAKEAAVAVTSGSVDKAESGTVVPNSPSGPQRQPLAESLASTSANDEPIAETKNSKPELAQTISSSKTSATVTELEVEAKQVDVRAAVKTAEAVPAGEERKSQEAQLQAESSKQTGASLLNPPAKDKAQADIVRAWRSSGTREGGGMQTQNVEATRQSQSANSSGQLQQFAESLRPVQSATPSAVASDAATLPADKATPASGNAATATNANSEPANPLRHEAAQSSVNSQTRPAQSSSFAQTLQAHNFSSKLGHSFGTNQWAESVSQRVSMMAAQRLGSAKIEIDPPELGAMTVKVVMDGDKASVSFMSANSQVREALEQSFPRLESMLEQQGLELADAQVSDNAESDQGLADSGANGRGQSEGEESQEEMITHSVNVPTGLVDYYA
ncbi:MAG: flagellar hook-length control protein FliK [Pseudohongiellaceae bacterium]|nr:flagellar hook-length control protein FliK [Pseudohongiellaceae bacterium]